MGAGAGKRLSAVRWGVAGNIVIAWLLTLPAAAAIGALTYGFVDLFPGAVGPLIVSVMRVGGGWRVRQEGPTRAGSAGDVIRRLGDGAPMTSAE